MRSINIEFDRLETIRNVRSSLQTIKPLIERRLEVIKEEEKIDSPFFTGFISQKPELESELIKINNIEEICDRLEGLLKTKRKITLFKNTLKYSIAVIQTSLLVGVLYFDIDSFKEIFAASIIVFGIGYINLSEKFKNKLEAIDDKFIGLYTNEIDFLTNLFQKYAFKKG
jgi:hypothetical protein